MTVTTEDSIKTQYNVSIYKTNVDPAGITVFLPGAVQELKEYQSTLDVLVEQKQLVIGFNTLNPFMMNPPFVRPHSEMADDVGKVVAKVCALPQYQSLKEKKYNIVGHSLGGKVALMVAASLLHKDKVAKVLALDPADDMPSALIPLKVDLNNATAEIYLRQSERGGDWTRCWPFVPQCPKDKNAEKIKNVYPNKIPVDHFAIDRDAFHLDYQDKCNPASQNARNAVQNMIREIISSE